MKDLFCPFREQKQRMAQGQHHIIYIKVDEDSYRLMATAKVEKQLTIPTAEDLPSLTHGTAVDVLVWQKTDLGFKVIINNKFQGQIYDNQTLDFAETLLRYLYENDGHCNLGDKSPAELIYDRFQVSKKAYKKAIGDLYRRRLITISDEGIDLA